MVSFWLPLTPMAPLTSSGVPTTTVFPDTAADQPKLPAIDVLEALR